MSTSEQVKASGLTLVKDPVARKIVAFHQDDSGTWVAELECGHTQHVRHDPPWTSRPWVTTEAGRHGAIGRELKCGKCAGAASEAREITRDAGDGTE